ncbi:MAG: tryptophan--tRNA ligase [Verrucomicrobia bacterium]|nr:tryptophan--tRNA ligase [Verrucomicrobiota bacterium]MCH8511578.1 tryptophan--tRNA ligase [Kiritimatiellia bacterium]
MRVLSGIQPSGKLHIGNYFGMMKPALALQEAHEVFLFIADYHALTTTKDAAALRENVRDVALDFLACGLDPARTVFYRQSDVPEVHELAWLLSVVCPMGLLERAHSYKDKTARGVDANHALFAYPVLMAADILCVNADIVPVGKDQKQHLEIARDLAGKFNRQTGEEVFKLADPMIREDVAVVPGVDGQKMSKSYGNTIEIFGPPKQVRKTIMRVVTDSTPLEAPKDPDACNVFALYKLFADAAESDALAERYRAGGMGYGEAKKALAEKFEEHFAPFRERRAALEAEPEKVDAILRDGAERARGAIHPILSHARRAVGLA